MKAFKFMFIATLFSVALISCEKDEDSKEDKKEDEKNEVVLPEYKINTVKRVDDNGKVEYELSTTYNDKNQITETISKYNEGSDGVIAIDREVYTYSDNEITVLLYQKNGDETERLSQKEIYTINEKEQIIGYKEYSINDEAETLSSQTTFSYEGEKLLKSASDYFESSNTIHETLSVIYDGDRIKEVISKEGDKIIKQSVYSYTGDFISQIIIGKNKETFTYDNDLLTEYNSEVLEGEKTYYYKTVYSYDGNNCVSNTVETGTDENKTTTTYTWTKGKGNLSPFHNGVDSKYISVEDVVR